MKNKFFFFLPPLLLAFHFLTAQPQTHFYRAWTTNSSHLTQDFTNHVVSVVSGTDTYVAGSTLGSSVSTYVLILSKYNARGTLQWSSTFTVNTGGNVHAGAITLDPSGNVLITGSAYNGTTNGYDLFVAKFNASGTKLWHQLYNGGGNSYDGGTAVVCGSNSNVYVSGGASQSAINIDVVTICYNSSGTAQWTQTWNNVSYFDFAGGIGLVSTGGGLTNVRVTGFTQVNATTWEYLALSYASTTGTLGSATHTNVGGTVIDKVNAAAFDAAGNVYITGAMGTGANGLDVKTVKLDASLNILWTATYNGTDNKQDVGRGIAVDAAGNVYVAGYTTSNDDRNALLIKYSSSGSQTWTQSYAGQGDDEFADLAITADSSIFVGGYINNQGKNDFYAALYSSGGVKKWSDSQNGLANRHDEIQQVVADGLGNFIVSGRSQQSDTSQSIMTTKYSLHYLVVPNDEAVHAPFIADHGQKLNTDGNPVTGLRYYSEKTYPNVYLFDTKVSYVFAHIDTVASTTDTMTRVDLSFYVVGGRTTIVDGLDKQEAFHNYYQGHIPEGRERVPLQNKVLAPAIYPHIDAIYGQGDNGLFIHLICKAGSTPSSIKLEWSGATSVTVQSDSSLLVQTILEDLVLPKMIAATISNNGTETATSWSPTYVIGGDGKVSISLGTYDTDKTLVIKIGRGREEEEIESWWSTYYGWTNIDMEAAVDCDQDGFVYTCGRSWSTNFPIGSTILSPMGESDWTVNKFNLSGEPKWFVMIGGPYEPGEFRERAHDISVGNQDFLYVGGKAATHWPSTMLPITPGGFHDDNLSSNVDGRGAVVKITKESGLIKWGTFFGDGALLRESILGVEALSGGGVAVVGYAQGEISTSQWQSVDPGGNAHQSIVGDMYIGEFDGNNGLVWATKFGPENELENDSNAPTDIVEDGNGNLFVVGVIIEDATTNDEFPTGGGLASHPGAKDGFVAKFADDRDLVWSTYLGGSALDYCSGVAFDPTNNDILVVGTANSTVAQSFPIVGFGNSALDDGSLGGSSDLFLAKFSNNGTLLQSRYFGGNGIDNTDQFVVGDNVGSQHPSNGIAVDAEGNIFITGSAAAGLPVTWPDPTKPWYFPNFSGGVSDGFVAGLAPNFKIEYCTYLGSSNEDHGTGIAVYNTDTPVRHNILMVGRTKDNSNNYPTAKENVLSYYHNAFQGGQFDGVISNIKTNAIIVRTQQIQIPTTAVKISPNPCIDVLSIEIDHQYLGNQGIVSIYDWSGRIIGQSILSSAQNRTLINVQHLIPGTYAIGVSSLSGTWSGKFVKVAK